MRAMQTQRPKTKDNIDRLVVFARIMTAPSGATVDQRAAVWTQLLLPARSAHQPPTDE
jgi:hypothetical protein